MESMKMNQPQKCLKFLKLYWRSLLVIVVPIIFLPVTLSNDNTPAYKCMYLLCIMAMYWITEALPLPITSMIPMVMFPLMGILDTDAVCVLYLKETVTMFLGGLIIALAIEFCNLHKRLALGCIQIIGCSPGRLNFGLLMVTMFMSFWISNTAATAMMCPIIEAILQELEKQGFCPMYLPVSAEESQIEGWHKRPTKITICYYLGAAYSSSIGGTATIIGSGTNLTFKGIYEARFPTSEGVSFSSFAFYNAPIAIINTCFVWVWLQYMYMGLWRPNSDDAKAVNIGKDGEIIAAKMIRERYEELGPMSFHEKSVAFFFVLAIVLFLTRDPGFVQGWSSLFTDKKVKDATAAILVVILFFVFPMNYGFVKFFTTNEEADLPKHPASGLLTWNYVNTKIPWGLIFLLGGGFAVAEGGKVSGMSKLIGDALGGLQGLPTLLILFLVCLAASIFTEFTANIPVANIILPVLAEMALAIRIHPLYLMLPAAISCSYAFHTPVGTPPNAIVASYANISSLDMGIGGIGPTIVTLILMWGGFPTFGSLIYPEINVFPAWAEEQAKMVGNMSRLELDY